MSESVLSKRLLKKAQKELHENPAHIPAHLESFKRWVASLPHIKYPLEDRLLLPFLRHAKYSQAKAQTRLDNFCTIRRSPELGAPHWFDFLPLDHPYVQEYFNTGIMLELGRTSEDVTMFLIRLEAFDPDKYDRDLIRVMSYMDLDRIMLNESTQIGGYGFVMDLTGFSSKHLSMSKNKRDMKLETKVWQEGYPLRVKHLIYYNEPAIMDALFKLMEVWISDKIRQRILRVRKNIEKAYDKVPGLKDIMPKEYGGGNKSIAEITERHKAEFYSFYSKPSPWTGVTVDESKRPVSAKNLMREYKDINFDLLGTEGTFVKLDPGE